MIWLSTQIICVVIMLNPFTICALSTNFSASPLCALYGRCWCRNVLCEMRCKMVCSCGKMHAVTAQRCCKHTPAVFCLTERVNGTQLQCRPSVSRGKATRPAHSLGSDSECSLAGMPIPAPDARGSCGKRHGYSCTAVTHLAAEPRARAARSGVMKRGAQRRQVSTCTRCDIVSRLLIQQRVHRQANYILRN